MKKILMLAGLVAAVGAMAQGQFNPSNYDTTVVPNLKVAFTEASSGAKLGAAYEVQLYAGLTTGSLVPVGSLLQFKINAGAGTGYFGIGTPAFSFDGTGKMPLWPGGTQIYVQAEVFETAFGSYAATVAANGKVGLSNIFPVTLSTPPLQTPAPLVGMTTVAVAPVPEPSVIALGVLGLGALLIRRRL
jgi:hypothetical protein